MTTVRPLSQDDVPACDAIIAALPYFFGLEVGIANAAKDVRSHEGWVTEDEGVVTGFLALSWSLPEAVEISWLAVHPDYRLGGRGRLLVEQAAAFASENGAKMLFLFASAEEDPPEVLDGLDGTRRFYEALGFIRLWVGRQADWEQVHLLLARAL